MRTAAVQWTDANKYIEMFTIHFQRYSPPPTEARADSEKERGTANAELRVLIIGHFFRPAAQPAAASHGPARTTGCSSIGRERERGRRDETRSLPPSSPSPACGRPRGSTIYCPSSNMAKKSRSYNNLLTNRENKCFLPNPNLYSRIGESRVVTCVCVERGRATAGSSEAQFVCSSKCTNNANL